MLRTSISHNVCKFQKDWMKKNAKFGDGPLKSYSFPRSSCGVCSVETMSSPDFRVFNHWIHISCVLIPHKEYRRLGSSGKCGLALFVPTLRPPRAHPHPPFSLFRLLLSRTELEGSAQ